MLVFPYIQLMPLMARNYLHVGSQGYGWLMTGVGIGAFLSGLAVARFADTRRKGLIESVALILYVSMILAFSFSRIYVLSFFLLVLGGIGFVTFTAFNQMLVQLHVEDDYRGRVLSLYTMSQGLNPFGALMMGFVADRGIWARRIPSLSSASRRSSSPCSAASRRESPVALARYPRVRPSLTERERAP